jgi:hypothetical protein
MKKQITAFKNRLTSVSKEEPLNRLSLATIIILDIIILNILFIGLNEHTDQLTTADEYMPPAAQEIFIRQQWTEANRISKLQPLILADRNNARYHYESPFDTQAIKLMHPAGREFYEQAAAIAKDPALHALFLIRQKTVEEREKIEATFDKAKKSYDTQLLENIANATTTGADSTATTAQQTARKFDQLTADIRSTEQQINADLRIQQLWTLIRPDDSTRAEIVTDYKGFQFWFPLKELLWQLLFLLPVFGTFYWWGSRSVKKDNSIQTLIATHLLVVASLPIILKAVELIIDIIPKHFFKNLFEFLQTLHLMALWHYFIIFAVIAVGLFLVYFIQRKVFNKQKVMQKRLAAGNCTACNKRLPVGAGFCPFCGTGQLRTCKSCGRQTPSGGICCIYCGTAD